MGESGNSIDPFQIPARPWWRLCAVIIGGIEVGRWNLAGLREAGNDAVERAVGLAEQWQAAGWVVLDGGVIRLSAEERFWQANLTAGLHDLCLSAEDTDPESKVGFGKTSERGMTLC